MTVTLTLEIDQDKLAKAIRLVDGPEYLGRHLADFVLHGKMGRGVCEFYGLELKKTEKVDG